MGQTKRWIMLGGEAKFTSRISGLLALVIAVAIGAGYGHGDERASGVGLPESKIAGLASTDRRTRDAAISELLQDGPIRLEEIQHAADTLDEILRMYARLTTPHRDWRSGHRIDEDDLKAAADYFVKYEAVPWLLQGLRNEDEGTRWVVATTLSEIPAHLKEAHRRAIVSTAVVVLKDTAGRAGSQLTDREIRSHLTLLVAELIGSPLPVQDREETDWRTKGLEVARQAEEWLQRQLESENSD